MVVTYTPDSTGPFTSVAGTAHGINYATSATYQADGQMTGFVSGNSGSFAGITNSFSYNKRLQPVNMSANSPSQTLFSIGYDFHVGNGTTGSDNGNVWSIYNYRDRTRDQSFNYAESESFRSNSASFRASILSFLFPFLSRAFFRGLQTTTLLTRRTRRS